jgi:hypothetical protein
MHCSSHIHCDHAAAFSVDVLGKQLAESGGRLALLVWNDGHELLAQGMLGAAGFGGSAKEA